MILVIVDGLNNLILTRNSVIRKIRRNLDLLLFTSPTNSPLPSAVRSVITEDKKLKLIAYFPLDHNEDTMLLRFVYILEEIRRFPQAGNNSGESNDVIQVYIV